MRPNAGTKRSVCSCTGNIRFVAAAGAKATGRPATKSPAIKADAEAKTKAKAATSNAGKRGSRVGIEHEGSRQRFRVRPQDGRESKSFKYTWQTYESVYKEAWAYYKQDDCVRFGLS